jgi:gluconate 2-dehydrogenase gamma chain
MAASQPGVTRRTALGLLGAGVLASRVEAAQQHLHAIKTDPKTYRLQFFTAQENALVDRVAEMILPADEHSPGAHEAKVSYFIDLVAASSADSVKADWKSRLAAFDKTAVSQHGRPFVDLAPGNQAAVLTRAAASEKNPSAPEEHFFADMKKATIFAYYTTEIGLIKELGYRGNQALASFPGCQDPQGSHR